MGRVRTSGFVGVRVSLCRFDMVSEQASMPAVAMVSSGSLE